MVEKKKKTTPKKKATVLTRQGTDNGSKKQKEIDEECEDSSLEDEQ